MDLIDEVIGYAKANAEAARTDADRSTWDAHRRNCEAVKAQIENLRSHIAASPSPATGMGVMSGRELAGWCDACGGEGKLYTSKYGGNDPDVWPTGKCEACDGTGYTLLAASPLPSSEPNTGGTTTTAALLGNQPTGDQRAEVAARDTSTPPKERHDWPLPSFDAQDWAEAFCKIANRLGYKDAKGGPVDEGWMLGWFANSLMRGFDEHARRSAHETGDLRDALLSFYLNFNGARSNANYVCKARGLLWERLEAIGQVGRRQDRPVDGVKSKLPARGVIANQLQASRIPGTRNHLGEQFDGPVLLGWADGIVTMLEAYGYKIVVAALSAAPSAPRSPVANPQSNGEAVVQPNTGGWPSEEVQRLVRAVTAITDPHTEIKSASGNLNIYCRPDDLKELRSAVEPLRAVLSLLPARETASGGWNEAIDAAAKVADEEAALHQRTFLQIDDDVATTDAAKDEMKFRLAARVRTSKFIADGIRALKRDSVVHSKLSKT